MGICIRIMTVTGIVFALLAQSVAADMSLTHKAGTYKMTKFGGTGENIPVNGPVIEVFSKNGQSYTTIANDNENLIHSSTVSGICGRRVQDFGSASVEIAGTSHPVSGTGGHVIESHVETFEFPFTMPNIPRTPAAACNFELDKRVAQGDRSREYWMERGFVVKYENAYEAKLTASCSGGLTRGGFGSRTIATPVWIACAPAEVATESVPKRMALPESRARPMALKVSARLEATRQGDMYATECPIAVRYTGSIWVSRPGVTVTYQIVGSTWDSPARTITFAKAGDHEITGWTERYRAREAKSGSIAAAPDPSRLQPDAAGSVVLKVDYEGGSTQSDEIPYRVFCNAEPPKASVIRIKD